MGEERRWIFFFFFGGQKKKENVVRFSLRCFLVWKMALGFFQKKLNHFSFFGKNNCIPNLG